MMVALFKDILLFLHVGFASGVLSVRGAIVIAWLVLRCPRPLRRQAIELPAFQKPSSPARLTPIWTGRVNSGSGPGETATSDRAGCEGAGCGRQGRSSFAF